jgi:biopolymer transport protein ExbB
MKRFSRMASADRLHLRRWSFMAVLLAVLATAPIATAAPQASAQATGQNQSSGPGDEPANVPVDEDMVRGLMDTDEPPAAGTDTARKPTGIDLLSLITQGGGFMIPIGLMSLLVVTLAVERLLSLRRKRLIPRGLVEELEALCDPIDRFNPSTAYSICQDYPSPAATAIEAMLMRTGQPLADVERAATEAVQREADDHAAPIRWLSLAAAATPLMGLLGTVWGMIVAFHESTTLTPDRSRSEQLSEGIYTALVTTLAGLVVAIPAAIFAQYLENRLAKYFHRIERLAFSIAPGLTRFVGRARLESDGTLRSISPPSQPAANAATAANPTATPPVAAASPVPAAAVAKKARTTR